MEKQTDWVTVVLRLVESGQLATLSKLTLDTEARMRKLERVAEASKQYMYSTNSLGKLGRPESQLYSYEKLLEALQELERE